MFRISARIINVVALCVAVGLPWLALQSIAWTTMLIENARTVPVCAAVKRTFDGAHPCSLCHVVQKGRAAENKSRAQTAPSKIDIVPVVRELRFDRLLIAIDYDPISPSFSWIPHSPPRPPPRSFPS